MKRKVDSEFTTVCRDKIIMCFHAKDYRIEVLCDFAVFRDKKLMYLFHAGKAE